MAEPAEWTPAPRVGSTYGREPQTEERETMKRATLTHEIQCSADDFWKVFFDREFVVTLFKDALKFSDFEILEQKESDAEILRRVRGRPRMNMPGPVQKVLGDRFGYEEEGRFDRKSKVWTWRMKPNALGDKLRHTGSLRVEAIDAGRCRRIAELELEAKVFGVGGLIESSAEKDMKEGWDQSASFMNRWIREHPPAGG
jgi:hypothetical protein